MEIQLRDCLHQSFSTLFSRIFNYTHTYKTTIGTVNYKLLQFFFFFKLPLLF